MNILPIAGESVCYLREDIFVILNSVSSIRSEVEKAEYTAQLSISFCDSHRLGTRRPYGIGVSFYM